MPVGTVAAAPAAETARHIRVLHLVAWLVAGGPERWIVDLCEKGAAEGLDMDIAVVQDAYGVFEEKARLRGIPVYSCPGAGKPLVLIRNLRRLLRAHGPYDAIHCHLHAFSGFAVLAARLEGVPFRVIHAHNVVRNLSMSLSRRMYVLAARTMIRAFATAGLAPSEAALEDLLGPSWRQDPRWSILCCGIDLEPFRAPISAASSREALGIPADALVLGSVGRIVEEKNSEFLVDILAAVLDRDPRAYLLLIGEGPLRERLISKAREMGCGERLVLPGTRSDVPAILRSAMDVFLFPSPLEALGIAVVEAQAAGLPAIISDGVPPEAIIVPDLVSRLPVAAGAARWAEEALVQARRRDAGSADRALAIVEQSDANCARSLTTLARLYAGKPAR